MADSPTTRNRLRKQEVGAKTNAWGGDLNEDGGSDRLDEALDGVVAFTLSGTKTLTSTNYETDEARMRIINVTGGTGGTVTIPAVEKWYLVRNGSSGSVAITNGSNTVTLTSGEICSVFTNGTTIYKTNSKDYVDSAILDASLSAEIPAQSGHAGQYIQTNGTTASWEEIAVADVFGLQTALDLKLNASVASAYGLTLLDDANAGTARATLGVVIGTDVQAFHANHTAFAGLSLIADRLPYADGTGTLALATFTAAGRALLDDADATAQRVTLGLVIGTNVAAAGANTDITALDQDVTITETGTIAANTLGFRSLPASSQSPGSGITLALADAGKSVPNTTGGWTIPANASIAFPVGTTIVLVNNSGSSQNIAITSDTLRLAGTSSTGTRALAQYGMATIYKLSSTVWLISGQGVT